MEYYKVKCIKGGIYFDAGKIYDVTNGRLYDNTGCVYSSINCSSVEEINNNNTPQFELYEDKPTKPRMCEITGLEIEEDFSVKGGSLNPYTMYADGLIRGCNDFPIEGAVLIDIINHPEHIIRAPKFSDDEKAVMREFIRGKYVYIARDRNNSIYVYGDKPTKEEADWISINNGVISLPELFFPQIQWSDPEPFNMKSYLEGLTNG